MANHTFHTEPQRQQEVLVEVEEEVKPTPCIILYNDDVNTFDHVIDSLIHYCDHEPEQAEQCALIVHNNGKCAVKNGSYEELVPICSALLDQGLSAKIEE
ncbi:MAG TPA: ATP-dependent Clp protease adaptor ClpS [Bacteroidia bacterium]|jgi:ATP-dependent Clp protease adaptor protein ClpS|nr:ATP-dependent Clp protease adaptor ClpS [Bacteroidia bacterium]